MSVTNLPRSWQGRWIWIALVPLLLGGGVFLVRMLFFQPAEVVEEAPPPQQVAVAALGRLEPEGEVVSVSGPSGDRISRIAVAEGDYVEANAVLAYLESYAERLAERNYAASQLAEAQARLQAETTYGRSQVEEAQTRLEQIDEPQAFEIRAQEATIRQLEAELALAQVDLNRSRTLEAEGAISRQELDQQVTEVRQKQEEISSARANLIRLQAARNSNLENARAQVDSAAAATTRSQAQVEVNSAARNLQLADARLVRTIIRAPRAGEILRIHTQAGEAIGDSGILDMGDTRRMNVVAEVYETDVGLVRLGQRATITSRNGAFDQAIAGRVVRIGSQIFKNDILDDDPAANADARVVEVTIQLDNSEPVRQLTNLQVDVQIDVATANSTPLPTLPPATPTPP